MPPSSRSSAANDHPQRRHLLKGKLGSTVLKGQGLERWQYEVTGGGRIWYVIDPVDRTVGITYAGTGHPKATD
ncbi:hypothetical protein GTY67_12755 [Streptomyces sp. SID8374]|nr:hypothetical protein [Streptomyces sp. SID8374]